MDSTSTNSYRVGFVMEQALGHITHTRNLQANVPKDPAVRPYWVPIAWETSGWAARLPVYRSNWTVRAGWRARRALSKLTHETELDVLFFHTQVTAVLAASWLHRVPGVISLDATPRQYDTLGQFYSHTPGPAWLEDWKWRLNRDCFRAAKHLVAWAEWTRQGLVADYEVAPDKVTVIPPGVNVRDWTRPAPRQLPSKGLPEVVKILFVGGNLERKGGLVLLDAFRALRGWEWERGDLAKWDGGLSQDWPRGRVELHLVTRDQVKPEPGVYVYNNMQPNSAELKQLYADCDIFCLPTYGDCLPMALSEAGAASLPVVSTRIAGIPEIVYDGESGYLIEPGDGAGLTGALRQLVADPALRLQMGCRGAEIVSQRFDAEKNAFRLLDLLKRIAQER
jgi:glycosyltransferase involved in cell wall biosynthesis